MTKQIEQDVNAVEEFISSNSIIEVARTGKGSIKYNYESKNFLVIPKEPNHNMEVFKNNQCAEALQYLYKL